MTRRDDAILKKYAQLLNGRIIPVAAESIMKERKLAGLNDQRRKLLALNDEAAVAAMKPSFDEVIAEQQAITERVEKIRKVLEVEMVEEEAKAFRNGVRARAVANTFRVNIEGVIYNYAREIMRIVMPWDQRTLSFIECRDEEGLDLKEINIKTVEILSKHVEQRVEALRAKADESVMDLEVMAAGEASAGESFGEDKELSRKTRDLNHLYALLESLRKGEKRRENKRQLEEVFEEGDRERRELERDRELQIKSLRDKIYELHDRESILLSKVKGVYDEDEKAGLQSRLSTIRSWKAEKEEWLRNLLGNGHLPSFAAEVMEPSKINSGLSVLAEFEVVTEEINLEAVVELYVKEAANQEAATERHEAEVRRLEEEIRAATTEGRFGDITELARERDEEVRKAAEARNHAQKVREKIAEIEAEAVSADPQPT